MMTPEEQDAAALRYSTERSRYVDFADALRTLCRQLCLARSVTLHEVTARAKDVESVRDKFQRHPEYESLDDMTDLCGVRIALYYTRDVTPVVAVIKDNFRVVEEVVHGADQADTFGYSSTHLLIRLDAQRAALAEWAGFADLIAEVQVRTVLQHAWAAISHQLDYRGAADIPRPVRRKLFMVAAQLETSDELFDQFRAEVEEIRGQYAEQAAKNEWHALEVDLDSVSAAWAAMTQEKVEAIYKKSGIVRSTAGPDSDRWTTSLSAIVELANQLGIKTMGQLAGEVRASKDEIARLQRVSEARAPDGSPYNLTEPGILLLLLYARNEDAAARTKVVKEDVINALLGRSSPTAAPD